MTAMPDRARERALRAAGHRVVVGIDEVGKGSWAGPLAVGMAVLPDESMSSGDGMPGVRDSKSITEKRREAMFDGVAAWCAHWSVGFASHLECDELGMADAQRLATRRALDALGVIPDAALVDGSWNFVSPLIGTVEMIVKGDTSCLSISAASILAKVTRDREMRRLAEHYPYWNLDANKGYPCQWHRIALQGHGPSAIHRRSWAFMDNFVPWPGTPRIDRSEPPTLF